MSGPETPGPSVGKLYVSSFFYHEVRGSETPSQPWIEVI